MPRCTTVVRYEVGAGPAPRVGNVCREAAVGWGAGAGLDAADGVVVVVLAAELVGDAVDPLVPAGAAVGEDEQPASAAHTAATVTRRGSPSMFRR